MFHRKFSSLFAVPAMVSFVSLIVLTSCGGGSKSVSVTVTAAANTVDGADTTTLTATVANDKNSDGVTWTLSGAGALSKTTTSSATYTAPAATGSSQSATITATSVADTTKTGTATIAIPAAPEVTTTSTSLTGAVGTALSLTLQGSGGIPPYKNWTVDTASGGNSLPACLTLSSAGAITTASGTAPTASCAGNYSNLIFQFTDSGTPTPLTATSLGLTITIAPAPAIAFGAAPTATGTFGTTYSSAVAAIGGAGALTYSLASGTLPPDLALGSSGTLSGTLGKAADVGTFTFAVSAADAYGDSATSGNYTIVVSYPQLTITTGTTLPVGYGNSSYSQTLAASGGSGTGYSWTVTSGASQLTALNLSLSPAGLLSGTPPQAGGSATFAVQVTDSASNKASATFTLTVKSGIAINAITLPTGFANGNYPPTGSSATLSATGGAGAPYTWSWAAANGSSLPAGLSIGSSSGAITGIPTTKGSYSVVVTAADSASNTANVTLAITIAAGVTVTAPTLAAAYPGTPYTSSAFAASGGSGTGYTWSWAAASSSSLPSGFTIGSSSGVISAASPANSGTATATYNAVVTATDSLGNKGSANATISIEASVAIGPAALPSGTVGVSYSQQLTASGGSGSGYTWSATGTNTLSNIGLAFSGGTVSGSSPTAGAGTFTAVLTDSQGHTAQATFTINVYSQLTITTTSLPATGVGASYSQTLNAGGGSGTGYTWSATGSNLSTYGLTLSSAGVVSGTPTQSGTASFTANVKDSASNTATQALSITIYSALSLPTPNPSSLSSTGYTGVAYTGSINASGGSGSYSWTVSGLSDGLTVSGGTTGTTLTISGTPTSATTVSFGATLKDTVTGATATQTGYTITVTTPTPVSLPAPSPQPSSLPTGYEGQPYTGAIDASGDVPPYTWSVNGTTATSSGLSVGEGLTATSSGGNSLSIAGTISNGFTGTIELLNVKVVDSLNSTQTQTYNITVNAPSTLAIAIFPVPQGMVNMPYTSNSVYISGGVSPYTISFSNLPAGLEQSTSYAWWVVGTPTSAGSTTVTVNVTDSASAHKSATFTINVVPETVATNNSELKGQYACYTEQYFDGGVTGGQGATLYRAGVVSAFTADGKGDITGGEMDTNDPKNGYESASSWGALSGSYAVGSDNRGYLVFTAASVAGNGSPEIDAIAGGNLNGGGQFTEFAFTGMDDVGANPPGKHAIGHCYLQNTTAISGSAPGGGYVWGMRGEAGDGSLFGGVGYVDFGSGTFSGVMDGVSKEQYQGDVTMTGNTLSAADSYGRVTFNFGATGGNIDPLVLYLTNNPAGEAVVMSANPHNASSNATFMIGEARAQNASAVAAAYPLSGPMVLYTSGLNTSSTEYKAQAAQLTGSTSTATMTAGPMLEYAGGTFKTENIGSMGLSINSSTGRTTLSGGSGTTTGDVFYVYNTGSAVVLFGDVGSGGTTPQNQLGWIEPQTPPTSGTWALGDLAASVFSYSVSNGDYNAAFKSNAITVNSSGAFTYMAQDNGGQNWADWDEPCTNYSGIVTCTLVPDTTYDPNGTYGIFDSNLTPQGGTAQTQLYCIAISVDKATNSNTRERMVCVDANTPSTQFSISQE